MWCQQVVNGPKSELLRIALASATQQTIVPVTPPIQNSTYTVQLFGPAIQCDVASTADALAFNTSLTKAYTDNSFFTYEDHFVPNKSLKYNAWVPHNQTLSNGTLTGVLFNITTPDWTNTTEVITIPGTVNGTSAGPVEYQSPDQPDPPVTDGSTLYMYMPTDFEALAWYS